MRIGRFSKRAADRKRYVVDYTDWLNKDEEVTHVVMTGSVPADSLYVDGYIVSGEGKEVIFFASGGVPLEVYDLTIKITTSLNQIKEDLVTIIIS